MGEATARMLSAAGAKLTLLDMNEAAVSAVADQIGALAIACDVADAASAEAAMTQASEVHGTARLLVNCAGIAAAGRIVARDGTAMPLPDFERVIKVNLIGSFNLLRLVAAGLRGCEALDDTGERGVIVNTASVAGYEGQIGQAAYSASKGGLIALTIQCAREFASMGVRVMTIAPGLIGTPMLLDMPQEVQDSLAASVPFPKRFGKPAEYAALVRHICENQMLNGEVIRLDGAVRLAPR
jgi:NAD(P)-dependent dehydrogenase (short-subunit alcohol dehydrogenase family)